MFRINLVANINLCDNFQPPSLLCSGPSTPCPPRKIRNILDSFYDDLDIVFFKINLDFVCVQDQFGRQNKNEINMIKQLPKLSASLPSPPCPLRKLRGCS